MRNWTRCSDDQPLLHLMLTKAQHLHEGDVVARLRDKVSCTRAIVRIRRTDSFTAAWIRRRQPSALEPQQRRDRLEVVLHPVVDLADRGVLGEQEPVRRRSSVTSRSSTTPPLTWSPARIGMQGQQDVTSVVWSNSSVTGSRRS